MANPEIRVEAVTVPVTPGQPETVTVRVWNDAAGRRTLSARVIGLDATWVDGGTRVLELQAGADATVELEVTLPTGFPASEYVAGLLVEPIDANLQPAGASTVADLTLVVRDAAKVLATLEPADVMGGHGGRLRVLMRNRTDSPLAVELHGSSPDPDLRVTFSQASIVLPPGQQAAVGVKVRGHRPFVGERRRRPFLVRVQGHTTPVILDGSFSQRPVFASSLLRAFLILGMLGLWVLLGLVLFGRYSSRATDKQLLQTAPKTTTPAGATTGTTNAGGGENGGTNGAPAAAPTTTLAPADQAAVDSENPKPARVSGKVTGPSAADVSDVTVTIEPKSPVSEDAQDATPANPAAPVSTEIGKVYGQLISSTQPEPGAARTTLTAATGRSSIAPSVTDETGTFAFADVEAPGFYLVTFSKPHYTTRKFTANVTGDGEPISFEVPMQAGDGTLSGRVVDQSGRGVGGADVTITNGTVTLTTRTPTTGDVGAWSVGGVSTPSSYVVSVSADGFGLESRLVNLGPSGENHGVDFILRAGVGTIHGRVTQSGTDGSPVGGVTVTVTVPSATDSAASPSADANGSAGDSTTSTTLGPNSTQTRSATTLTLGDKGTYSIPGLPLLPAPSAYTLTVSGPGWTTQTQSVPLRSGQQRADVLLSHDSATIRGNVASAAPGHPALSVAGVVLASDTVTRKQTTDNNGNYSLDAVPPGRYVVTIEKFGFISESVLVEVAPGQETARAPDVQLEVDTGGGNIRANARVLGQVLDAATSTPLIPAAVVLKMAKLGGGVLETCPKPFHAVGDHCEVATKTGAGGNYSFPDNGTVTATNPGIPPGRYEIQASFRNHETTTVRVLVPSVELNGAVNAPTALLPESAIIRGTLVSNALADDDPGVDDFKDQAIKLQMKKRSDGSVVRTDKTAFDGTVTAADDGTFDFGHVQHGDYAIVTQNGPDFLALAPTPITVEIAVSQTVPVHMDRKAHLILSVKTFASGTQSTVDPAFMKISLDGTCDVVGNNGHPQCGPRRVTMTSTGVWLVRELSPGVEHTVLFKYSPPGDAFNDETRTYTVAKNTTKPDTVVLTREPDVTTIIVQYTLDGVATPIPQALVSLNGVVGFNPDGSSITQSFTLTTDTSGRVRFVPPATVGDPNDCADPAADSCTVRFQSDRAFLSIADSPAFIPRRFDPVPPTDIQIFTIHTQNVTPTPGRLATTSRVTLEVGTITPPGFLPPVVSVTSAPAGVSPADIIITATAAETNKYALAWRDIGAATPGDIRVGTYTLTVHKDGLTDTAATFTAESGSPVNFPADDVPDVKDLQIVLHQKAYVTLRAVTRIDGIAISGARYTLQHGTDPEILPCATASSTSFQCPSGLFVAGTPATEGVFEVDSLQSGSGLTFTGDATKDGYGHPTGVDLPTVPPVAQGTNLVASPVQLDQLATVTGVVRGVRGSAITNLGGVSVRLTDLADSTKVYNGTTSSNAAVAPVGSFSITGTRTTLEGLATGHTFRLQIVSGLPPGYVTPAARNVGPLLPDGVCAVTPGCPNNVGNIDAIAQTFTVQGDVTDADTGDPIADVLVTLSGTLATGGTRMTNAAGHFSFANIVPVQYTISFVKSGYQRESHTIDLELGIPPADQDQALVPNRNEVKGTTRGKYGTHADFALNGVTAQLRDAITHANVGPSQTPAGNAYDFVDLADGNYEILFTKTGFVNTVVTGVNVGGGPPAVIVDPAILPARTHPVKVTVRSAVGNALISGAGVTLTPHASAGNTADGTLGPDPTVTGVVTFAEVVPGDYDITVVGNGAHRNGTGTVTVPTDNTTTDVPATVTIAEARISGTASITDSGGTSGSGLVKVEIFSGATATGTAVDTPSVAANGVYHSRFLAAGAYTVKFSLVTGCPPDCYVAQVVTLSPALANGTDRDIDGAVRKWGSITGTVLLDNGTDPPDGATGATVNVYLGTDTTGAADFTSGVDATSGDYDLALPPGGYTVVYKLTGFPDQRATVSPALVVVAPGTPKPLADITFGP